MAGQEVMNDTHHLLMEAEHSKGKRKVKEKLDIVFSILNSKSTMGARTRDPSHMKLHFDSAT